MRAIDQREHRERRSGGAFSLANDSLKSFAALEAAWFEFIQGDVRDAALLAKLLPKARTVYHLACLGVRHSLHSPEENHSVNAKGPRILLEAVRGAGVERFIYASSSEIYAGLGSVVVKDVPARRIVTGNPAKLLAKKRC